MDMPNRLAPHNKGAPKKMNLSSYEFFFLGNTDFPPILIFLVDAAGFVSHQ
jgi:hypothetical protein